MRRGFALAELLVALVIAGIIGLALTRLSINQARFISVQDGMMRARLGARATLNVMGEELRMVGTGGLRAATRDSITVRAPYAYGVACRQAGGATWVSLLPADSASFAAATPSGYAWRDTLGVWQFVEPVAMSTSGLSLLCNLLTFPAVGVVTATGWGARIGILAPNVTATKVGAPVYLYQTITYRFAASAELPGRRALWRRVHSTGSNDEIVVPFDTSARFSFLTGDTLGIVSTPPASLDSVRGVHVVLRATSESAPAGRSAPVVFDLSTNIVFRNRAP